MGQCFRGCQIDDLLLLRELSYRTFTDTFSHMNTSANMNAYLDEAYNVNKLRDEILNSNSFFYFLYVDHKLAGYIKVNESMAQTDIYDPRSLELERIYLIKDFQGKGFGNVLMSKVINVANTLSKSYIWLGVWEKNDKAIQFYKKNGFYTIGKHSFFMGEEEQTDYIMRKDLIISE